MKSTRRSQGATFMAQVAWAAQRMEAAIAGAGRGRGWRDETDVRHTGSQDPPRDDRTTGMGE